MNRVDCTNPHTNTVQYEIKSHRLFTYIFSFCCSLHSFIHSFGGCVVCYASCAQLYRLRHSHERVTSIYLPHSHQLNANKRRNIQLKRTTQTRSTKRRLTIESKRRKKEQIHAEKNTWIMIILKLCV